MKFIRKNGRIIPIKNKKENPYKRSAKIGAGAGIAGAGAHVLMKGADAATAISKMKTAAAFGVPALGLGVAAAGIGLYSQVRSVVRGVEQGKKDKSILSGLGTYYADNLVAGASAFAGAAIGTAGLYGAAKGVQHLKKLMALRKVIK